MKNERTPRTRLALFTCTALLGSSLSARAQDYTLDLAVEAPSGNLLTIDTFVGINDLSLVGFTGTDNQGSKGFVTQDAAPGYRAVTFFSSTRVFSGASLNNASPPEMATRDRVSGSPPVYLIRKWNTQTGGHVDIGVSPTNFDSASSFVDINDGGIVALAPLVGGSTSSTLAAGTAVPPTTLATYSGIQFLRPQISSTNQVIIRDNLGRIISWPYPSGAPTIYASTTTGGFTATFNEPGISADGTVAAFGGTDATSAGLFVSVAYSGGQRLIPLVRVGSDDFSAFFDNQRVGVTSSGPVATGKRITVVFAGTRNGLQGVYARSLVATEQSGDVVSDLKPIQAVIRNGDTVESHIVNGFRLNDPINASGVVAVWVGFGGSASGIVRAKPETGSVVMGPLRLPMKNVSVEYGHHDASGFHLDGPAVMTDENGHYTFDSVTPGIYRVRAHFVHPLPGPGEPTDLYNYPNNAPDLDYLFTTFSPPVIPDIVIPDPVVMIAGWRDNRTAWTGPPSDGKFLQFFAKDPEEDAVKIAQGLPAFLCFVVDGSPGGSPTTYDNDASSVTDHTRNGSFLRSLITNDVRQTALSQWLTPTDVDRVRVSIVSHSMGGIIARSAVTGDPSVRWSRIVCLDSPHGGSETASWTLAMLGIFHTIPFGLQEGPMNGRSRFPFTAQVTSGWNEGFRSIDRPLDWLLYDASLDIVVFPGLSAQGSGRAQFADTGLPSGWYGSSTGTGNQSSLNGWVRGLVRDAPSNQHSDQGLCLPIACAGIPILKDPAVQIEVAHFLLGRGAPGGATVPPSTTPSPPPPVAGLGGVGGNLHAPAGSTVSLVLPVDAANHVSGRFTAMGSGLQVVLRDPSGSVATVGSSTSQQIASDVQVMTVELASPPIGNWTIQLIASPVAAADLGCTLYSDNGRQTVLDIAPSSASVGQPVQIAASIVDATFGVITGTGSTAQCQVLLPDETVVNVSLLDDGVHGDGAANDGLWGGTFTGTLIPGRYRVAADLRTTLGAETVERMQHTDLVVAPASALLSGSPAESTPDVNANGKFDALVFTQAVSFATNGTFQLTARLVDGSGGVISSLVAPITNSSGTTLANIQVAAPGTDISRHGVDGPWRLSNIVLYDLGAGSLPTAFGAEHVTAAYAASAFEAPPPPRVSWIQPSGGPRTGGNQVVIGGENFTGTTEVRIDLHTCTFSETGDSSLVVLVPANYSGTQVDVRVTTPFGTNTLVGGYTYEGVPTTGALYCFGDGSGTACPCGNTAAPGSATGCLSSLGIGGRLIASGSSSLAADTLVLQGSQMPNAPCLYFQGTAQQSGGAGSVFGDGLRCASGTIIRLSTRANVGGSSQYPTSGDASVSVRGLVSAPGTRTYQVWYRNAASFCTASTFNLTNGLGVSWSP